MAKIVRYDGDLKAFAIDSTGTNRTVFGDVSQSDTLDDNVNTDYRLGWQIVGVNEFPSKQDFNALGFTLGQLLAYLHQVGIPEWNISQEYHTNSITNRNGVVYVSQSDDNTGNDPETDSVNWSNPAAREPNIFTVGASVASSALTVTLDPCTTSFRSDTLNDGTVNSVTTSSQLSLTVSSGSTLGTTSAEPARLLILELYNGGTPAIGIVNEKCGLNLDESGVVTTVAEGGAGGADSATTIYSASAIVDTPYRIVGWINSTQPVAGTWDTAPTKVQGAGGNSIASIIPANVSKSVVKAWVNFDGTGAVAIRDSLNVSSITDNGVGDYTVNFATALANANYAVTGSNVGSSTGGNSMVCSNSDTPTTSAVGITLRNTAETDNDCNYVHVTITGGV